MMKQFKVLILSISVLMLPTLGAAENCADMDSCMTFFFGKVSFSEDVHA